MPDISKSQIGYIKSLAANVFPYDDEYRAWLSRTFGVESCTALTRSQGITAIDDLKAMADGKTPPPTHRGRFTARGERGYAHLLTQEQADEIARHQDLLGWGTHALNRFLNRQTGKQKSVSMLTKREATKVLTGMQRILDENLTARG